MLFASANEKQQQREGLLQKTSKSQESFLPVSFGLARCTRCGCTYEQSDEQRCYFHPGSYTNFRMMGPAMMMWTCCNSYDSNERGCKAESKHVQCKQTAASLEAFPQVPSPAEAVGLRRRAAAAAEEAEKAERPKKAGPPPGATKYTCGVGDSLQGVALKHSMTVAELKRWNKLLSGTLYAGLEIYVRPPPPRSEAEVRAQALRTIRRHAPEASQEEAAYYLDEHGGGTDPEAALAAMRADATASGAPVGSPAAAVPASGSWVLVDSAQPLESPPRYGK